MKKLSALEFYQKKGHLEYGDKRWTSLDRLIVGKRLYSDFYNAGISDIKAIDYSAQRVDTSFQGTSDGKLVYLDKFNKAIRVLDEYQFKVICQVVLLNKRWKPSGSERIKAHKMYLSMHVLCWGLDRLISHYLGIKRRKGKIK